MVASARLFHVIIITPLDVLLCPDFVCAVRVDVGEGLGLPLLVGAALASEASALCAVLWCCVVWWLWPGPCGSVPSCRGHGAALWPGAVASLVRGAVQPSAVAVSRPSVGSWFMGMKRPGRCRNRRLFSKRKNGGLICGVLLSGNPGLEVG